MLIPSRLKLTQIPLLIKTPNIPLSTKAPLTTSLLKLTQIPFPAKTHTVSVSKDSGFYTEEPEDEDPVLEIGIIRVKGLGLFNHRELLKLLTEEYYRP